MDPFNGVEGLTTSGRRSGSGSGPDPHLSEKSDPDLHISAKRDPDPHESDADLEPWVLGYIFICVLEHFSQHKSFQIKYFRDAFMELTPFYFFFCFRIWSGV